MIDVQRLHHFTMKWPGSSRFVKVFQEPNEERNRVRDSAHHRCPALAERDVLEFPLFVLRVDLIR